MAFKRYLFCFFLLLPFLSLTGCHETPSNQGFEYNFENLTDKAINVKIYNTQSDYNTGTNAFLSGRMEVRGYYTVPMDKFVEGRTYYVDWYSDDYLYSNWFWSSITLRNTFTPSATSYEFLVNTVQYADPSRNIWMKGSGISTTWVAADAFTLSGSTYTSTWSSLSTAQQDVQLILNRDFTAHLKLKNASNQTIDSALTYQAIYDNATGVSNVTLLNIKDSVIGNLKSNFMPHTSNFNGPNNYMMLYVQGLGYYQMNRL